MKNIFILSLFLILGGCSTLSIDPAIRKYRAASFSIQLGDTKEKVLSVLLPTQEKLSANASKSSESFIKDEDTIEIYYFRSGRQPDGLTTDDEFTPYIFTNGILTGIGWTVLGGPKSKGQVIQPAPQQTTIVY